MHPDYRILENLFLDLTKQASAALQAADNERVKQLTAQMEALNRCMDCLMRDTCPRKDQTL